MKLKNQKSNIDWETRLGKFGASDIAQILPEPIQNKVYKTKPDRYGYTDYTVNEKGEYVVDGHKYYELLQVAISLIERKQTEIFYGKELRSPNSQAILWGQRWEKQSPFLGLFNNGLVRNLTYPLSHDIRTNIGDKYFADNFNRITKGLIYQLFAFNRTLDFIGQLLYHPV